MIPGHGKGGRKNPSHAINEANIDVRARCRKQVKKVSFKLEYFPRFNIAEPIYFNMVRDPVERVISWYYYVRAPWYFVERKRAFPDLPLPNPNWLRKVRPSNPVFEKFF